MQEITRRHHDGSVEQNTLLGLESIALKNAFARRRKEAERELDRGDVESVTIKESRRIGRNDLCPCGSQVKFKHCCGSRLAPDDDRIAD